MSEGLLSIRRIVKRIFVGIVNDVDDHPAGSGELHRAKGEGSLSSERVGNDLSAQLPMRTIPGESNVGVVSVPYKLPMVPHKYTA